jgi:Helicase associated domain
MNKKLLNHFEAYKNSCNLNNKLEAIWLERFYELVQFKHVHGHFKIPVKSIEFKKLHHWLIAQRHSCKFKTIDPKRAQLLQLIGIKFREKPEKPINNWNETFNKVIKFKEEFGHVNIPVNYPDKQLYSWLRYQKTTFRAGNLDQEKIAQLTSIGFDFRCKADIWDKNFQKLVEFKNTFGHLQVCRSFTNDHQLINFVRNLVKRKNELSKDKIKRLNKIKFIWEPGQKVKELNDARWLDNYEQLTAFKEKYGHCQVPYKKYQSLYTWVNYLRYHKDLSEEKRLLLEKLDFFDNSNKINAWNKKLERLLDFKKKYGHFYVCKSLADSSLVYLVKDLRRSKNRLSKEQIKSLDQIGFLWKSDQQARTIGIRKAYEDKWLKQYEQLKAYKELHGNIKVSRKVSPNLSKWIATQKSNKRLSDKQLSLLKQIEFFDTDKKKTITAIAKKQTQK